MNSDKQEIINLMKHDRIKGAILLVLLLLSVFLLVKTFTELKSYRFIGGGVPISNTITVSGEGEVFAVADIASFNFSVVEEAKTVAQAQETATRKINIILALLDEAEVEEKDIKTQAYNIYPKYEYTRSICTGFNCPPNKRELVGYEVNQSVSVKIRDIETAGEILAEIGAVGVNNVSGLSFTIDDEDDLLREARKQAIEEAQTKAKELAKDLNVKLVRVVNFSESGNQPVFARFATLESQSFDTLGGAVPEIPVGENKITSRVSITYEIR